MSGSARARAKAEHASVSRKNRAGARDLRMSTRAIAHYGVAGAAGMAAGGSASRRNPAPYGATDGMVIGS